ncbi:hypothetical protein [Okeania sp.]|uniref:hypothetical protein n=1 Tax=Okeania sp. TaxID=3100323 RepID=UPI002B4B9025|nr:hypothetical protein [Okeania sp.]MEB3341280.1 hypothetical protein [Okeania sp.]
MKKTALITTVLITSIFTIYPRIVLSENASTYEPGYWQPKAQAANPKKPIILNILNQSGKTLTYNLVPEVEKFLPAGENTKVRVDLSSITNGYGTVNIYGETPLSYEYSAYNNVVTVRVKSSPGTINHKSIYISSTGQIYSF